jgi:hypothetical protein
MMSIRHGSGFAVFHCSWLLIAMVSTGATQAAEAPAKTDSQLQAAAVLQSMAEYLAALEAFSCTSSNSFDAVQTSGQRIEFGETRRISLERPNRLRIDEVSSDGTSDMALFDGSQITMLSADQNVYAQAPQPPSIEDALVYFVRDLRMRMPLALLLSTHVRTELPTLAKNVDYVESTQVRGQKAHHIAGRGDSVDFQFWIAEGASPLPLRIVIVYKLETGQPRFAADISDWNVKPSFEASTFKLALPADARRIPFAVQFLAPATQQPAATGEVKP